MNYKYSKLARQVMPRLSWEELISYQEQYNICTGKTTGQLLQLIGSAMNNPEKRIPISKFVTFSNSFQVTSSGAIADQLVQILGKLQLNFFKLRLSDLTIEYNPYGYVMKDWVVNE